jgi:alpha-D-ribose 1-methylphosphonate 5-triphosphate synthase subunit PhnI
MKYILLCAAEKRESRLQSFVRSTERKLLHLARATERGVERAAKTFVPAINFSERIVLRKKRATLRTHSILHFNQQPTCFSRN